MAFFLWIKKQPGWEQQRLNTKKKGIRAIISPHPYSDLGQLRKPLALDVAVSSWQRLLISKDFPQVVLVGRGSSVEDKLQRALRAIYKYDSEALRKIAIENRIGTQVTSVPEPFQTPRSQRQWPPLNQKGWFMVFFSEDLKVHTWQSPARLRTRWCHPGEWLSSLATSNSGSST